MLTALLKVLLREYRAHRLARFTVWVLAYGAALWSVDQLSGGAPAALWALFWLAAITCGVYYLGRLLGFIRQRLLWRLRRRLIVTYVFIAIVPIVLIVFLVGLGIYIVNGQFAAFLVARNLRENFDELQQVNRVVTHEAHIDGSLAPEKTLDGLQNFYVKELHQHAISYPGLEIVIRIGSQVRAFRLDGTKIQSPLTIPAWFKQEEFAGFVMDRGHLALRSIERGPTAAGSLVVILSQPITQELLDMVGEGIGPVGVVPTGTVQTEPSQRSSQSYLHRSTPEGEFDLSESIFSKNLKLPEPVSRFDFIVRGASSLDPVFWEGEKQEVLTAPAFVYVTSRVIRLNRRLLETAGEFSQIYVFAFEAVAVIFLIIEGIALVIGVRLTRSITSTVDRLYGATERVKKGDFSYRIRVPSNDQISALGEAFDSMTASVERLLLESEEKLRLESELEIAREVQAQLFPRSAPEVPGLALYGVCKAARSVSGDYYDFLKLGEDRVCLVLGDVSGKGISAALLMAAMQSALRAQFYDGYAPSSDSHALPLSTAAVVSRLNLQLYENTPREKYVTFFFGVYDAATRTLTYTNAGHLPPVLLRQGKVERLRVGGTVVGLFSPIIYDQAEIQIQPGDLLLAFTDGITEPENIYGEEFGEDRMLEVVRRALSASPQILVEEIYRSVNDWTGSPELQDDMTLVVAKASE
ncbi:MAG: PP2C family protein-serine/threonine phosphatase [Terriglobia bacterium]